MTETLGAPGVVVRRETLVEAAGLICPHCKADQPVHYTGNGFWMHTISAAHAAAFTVPSIMPPATTGYTAFCSASPIRHVLHRDWPGLFPQSQA